MVGSTGVRKSSLIKLLTGDASIATFSVTVGTTLQFAEYKAPGWEFVEVLGLSKGIQGILQVKAVAKAMRDPVMAQQQGFSAILFVYQHGHRIGAHDVANYQLFHEALCDAKVPLLLVVSRCELDDPINRWWLENQATFRNQFKWMITDGMSACTIDDESKLSPIFRKPIALAKQESKTQLWKMLQQHALSANVPVQSKPALTNMWKVMIDHVGWRDAPADVSLVQ